MKLFCAGVGAQHPDIENASRRMKKSEYEDCAKNGVDKIAEIQVGLDGVAFAEAKGGLGLKLTPEDEGVPRGAGVGGELDIDARLEQRLKQQSRRRKVTPSPSRRLASTRPAMGLSMPHMACMRGEVSPPKPQNPFDNLKKFII